MDKFKSLCSLSLWERAGERVCCSTSSLSPTLSHRERGQVCWQIDSDLSRVHVIDKNKNFCKSKQGRYEICPYKPSFAKVSA
ncbi:hypothetical protein [Alysiella filiformis]|uniref:hypothetical protein n=1 Tax=Alysiella filiformis TaxID=194196 RepID=UPI0015CB1A5F|nr:hypothetical protein [Alysiella filiformis]